MLPDRTQGRANGIAVVTGAASGMGAGVAQRMSADGWPLLLCDFNADRLAELAAELAPAGEVRQLAGDITAGDFGDRLVACLDGEPIGALVHCAAITSGMGDAARILEVCLGGTLALVDTARAHMAPGSAAVLFASMVGPCQHDEILWNTTSANMVPALHEHLMSDPAYAQAPGGSLAYVYGKRGVQLAAQREAPEFGRRGARIVSLSPGIIDTPMARASMERYPPMAQMIEISPLARWGQSEEIAAAAAFLCSPQASFITGCDLQVDGGLVARQQADARS